MLDDEVNLTSFEKDLEDNTLEKYCDLNAIQSGFIIVSESEDE